MAETCSCWLKICLLQNHQLPTGHRQPTTDTAIGCPPPIDHRPPTHRQVLYQHTDSPTGPPPTQWFTNRLSTDPIDHQLFGSTKLIITEVGCLWLKACRWSVVLSYALKYSRNIEIKYLFHSKAYNYYNYMLNSFITSCINTFSLILILKYNLSSFFLSIHHSHMNKVQRLNEYLSNTYQILIKYLHLI